MIAATRAAVPPRAFLVGPLQKALFRWAVGNGRIGRMSWRQIKRKYGDDR